TRTWAARPGRPARPPDRRTARTPHTGTSPTTPGRPTLAQPAPPRQAQPRRAQPRRAQPRRAQPRRAQPRRARIQRLLSRPRPAQARPLARPAPVPPARGPNLPRHLAVPHRATVSRRVLPRCDCFPSSAAPMTCFSASATPSGITHHLSVTALGLSAKHRHYDDCALLRPVLKLDISPGNVPNVPAWPWSTIS